MTTPAVYVAGSSADLYRVKHWIAKLEAAGVRVSSSWPGVVETVGAANPRDASRLDRYTWSVVDLDEVRCSAVLWFLVPPVDVQTRGAWIELGAAFASGITIVSSGDTSQSIFCALGAECAEDVAAFEHVVDLATGRDRGSR